MRLEPLGDQAAMAYCDNEAAALALARRCRQVGHPWIEDVVQAYTTVAVFYDVEQIDFEYAAMEVHAISAAGWAGDVTPGPLHIIPVCYELGLDLSHIPGQPGLPVEEGVA